MGLKFDTSGLASALTLLQGRAEEAVRMYAETAAKKLQSEAQREARWSDRTGAARGRLRGYTEPRPSAIRIVLAHGVDYGIWLELAKEKRYAIIQPTIELKSVDVFRGLDGLFNRMGR